MTFYYLVEENHKTNETIILQSCYKYEGLELIDLFAEYYIKERLGDIPIKYYSINDHNRPYTYYIEKSRINGLTIKKKFINKGYIFNDVIHENVISWYLVHDKYNIIQYDNNQIHDISRFNLYDEQKYGLLFNTTMLELLDKFQNKIPE